MNKKCIKIIDNLYLGDMHSIPKNCDIVISVATELFKKNTKNIDDNFWYWNWNKNIFFMDFENSITLDNIKYIEMIKKFIDTIDENIKNKNIYVHCLFGINRSPALIFIYLVYKNKLSNKNFNQSLKEFNNIYTIFYPNQEWNKFLKNFYPFKHLYKKGK